MWGEQTAHVIQLHGVGADASRFHPCADPVHGYGADAASTWTQPRQPVPRPGVYPAFLNRPNESVCHTVLICSPAPPSSPISPAGQGCLLPHHCRGTGRQRIALCYAGALYCGGAYPGAQCEALFVEPLYTLLALPFAGVHLGLLLQALLREGLALHLLLALLEPLHLALYSFSILREIALVLDVVARYPADARPSTVHGRSDDPRTITVIPAVMRVPAGLWCLFSLVALSREHAYGS